MKECTRLKGPEPGFSEQLPKFAIKQNPLVNTNNEQTVQVLNERYQEA